MNSDGINIKGTHLIVDCLDCENDTLVDKRRISDFIENTITMLGMKKLIDPVLVQCDGSTNDWDKGGYSAFAMIAESHISIHTFPQAGLLSADIYSCKPFDVDLAIDGFRAFFFPSKIKKKLLNREVQLIRQKELGANTKRI